MPIDKFPLTVKQFKGKLVTDIDNVFNKYTQGEIPFEHALESTNIEYLKKGGFRTRTGLENYVDFLSTVVGKPIQFWEIKILKGVPQVDRYLILSWDGTTGRLYDTGVPVPVPPPPFILANPILTLTGMKYAFVINAFSRIYITPWSAFATPLSGGKVYVYTGGYNARTAKYLPPVIGTFTATATVGGNCTPGLHLCTVLYETDTGYITTPDPTQIKTPTTVTTTTANATITFNNIPAFAIIAGDPRPLQVIRRHIIITRIVVNNDNQGLFSYEPFFAVIVDGPSSTGPVTFALPDSALLDSAAEYIQGTFTEKGGVAGVVDVIPACVSFAVYSNRLVYICPNNIFPAVPSGISSNGVLDSAFISPPNEPEQIETNMAVVTGGLTGDYDSKDIIRIGKDFAGNPNSGAELNGVLYIFKDDSTFAIVEDLEKDPIEWNKPALVDAAKGAFPFGITQTGNNPSPLIDGYLLVAGKAGLYAFNGTFSQQSLADGIWEQYHPNDLRWMKMVNDSIRKILFIRIGDPNLDVLTDEVTSNNSILFANYYHGLSIEDIRWGSFTYLTIYPISGGRTIIVHDILLRTPGTGGTSGHPEWFNLQYPLLTILHHNNVLATTPTHILSHSIAKREFEFSDPTHAPFPIWNHESGYTPNEQGEIYTFGPLHLRGNLDGITPTTILGDNFITVSKGILDDSNYDLVGTLTPGISPKKFMSINLNAVHEQLRLKLSGKNHVLVQGLTLFATERGKERPR